MTPGFRLFEPGRAAGGRGSGIIPYRLDPATMAITGIDGDSDELLGFPPEEWCRPGFRAAYLHHDDREALAAFSCSWRERPHSYEAQYRMYDVQGRLRWVHDVVEVRVGSSGTCAQGVLIDITGLAAGHEERFYAQRLRDELLRIFAEEVGGPLRSISAYVEMLGRHLSSQSDHVGSDYAIGLHGGVQQLHALAARLVRLSHTGEAGLDGMIDALSEIRVPER